MHEYQKYLTQLRNCWEGCIPWDEAIQMIGAPDCWCDELCSEWCSWERKFEASQGAR